MIFENPYFALFLVALVPMTLLWIYFARLRRKKMLRFAESSLVNKMVIGENARIRVVRFVLVLLGFLFLISAATGPMLPGGKEKVKTSGIDIIIALDLSNSMRAEDIQPNRLERAKLALSDLLNHMGSDRVGIVVFGGNAYTALPLTDDHEAAQSVLKSLNCDMVTYQGTAIGAAIDQAVSSFSYDDEDRGKAIILISDGENHEDDAIASTARAASKGIVVCTIGIGSATGARIPEYDLNGRQTGYKRDASGQEVITLLDEEGMKQIAQQGNGIYVQASSADLGAGQVYSELQKLNKTSVDTYRYTTYSPVFRWLLLISFLFFGIESVLPEGNRKEKKSTA